MKIHLLNLLFLISLLSFSQSIVISGVVFDETEKDPLIGVNIISGDIGTTTDIDGKYNLELNMRNKTMVKLMFIEELRALNLEDILYIETGIDYLKSLIYKIIKMIV